MLNRITTTHTHRQTSHSCWLLQQPSAAVLEPLSHWPQTGSASKAAADLLTLTRLSFTRFVFSSLALRLLLLAVVMVDESSPLMVE